MMMKIKSTKQLQAEKKRLRQRREELEYKVRNNWSELKECLRPVNIAKDTINSILQNKTEKCRDDGNILKNSFAYGVSLLTKKIADKAGEKLSKVFK